MTTATLPMSTTQPPHSGVARPAVARPTARPAPAVADAGGASIQRRIVWVLAVGAVVSIGALAWAAAAWIGELLEGRPADLESARMVIWGGTAILLALIVLGLGYANRFVLRRVSDPATALAVVAERVAAGDLVSTTGLSASASNDEIGRLTRATEAMVGELRRLVSAIRDSAGETAAMSSQITSAAEEMSAAASEIAQTSSDLSHQSSEMAQTIQGAAADAGQLRDIAEQVARGAQEGVTRNARLRALAQDNRERLDGSTARLEALAEEAAASAAAAEALTEASEGIRAFVTLVRKIARQSKLLALNASMEAARAGEQGRGFAVVASEIRKLASTSTEAAERTEAIVNQILERVQQSRESSRRTAVTVASVRMATREATASFAQVEEAVLDAEQWVESIEHAAGQSATLVAELTARLDNLSRGTESFAAAMQQVAASSEQQSASTQEIAATANTLETASRRLAELVAAFRLDRPEPITGPRRARPSVATTAATEPAPSARPAAPPPASLPRTVEVPAYRG